MIKKLIALVGICTLLYLPSAQAGSFGGGGVRSTPSISTSRPSVSTPSSSVSRPSTSSTTTSKPTQNTTYSSKGGFSNTTNAPSTSSTRPSTTSPSAYRSSTMTPSSSVRTSPTYYSNNVHWYTPSSWGTGFTSGLFLGSMMHPWGGYYGYGAAYGGYGFSIGAMIADVIFLIIFLCILGWIIRICRR